MLWLVHVNPQHEPIRICHVDSGLLDTWKQLVGAKLFTSRLHLFGFQHCTLRIFDVSLGLRAPGLLLVGTQLCTIGLGGLSLGLPSFRIHVVGTKLCKLWVLPVLANVFTLWQLLLLGGHCSFGLHAVDP